MAFLYEISEHKTDGHKFIIITGYEGNIRNLEIPEFIDANPVEAIGNHAFSGRQDIYSVVLPKTIKTLYGFAFHNCRNLKKIALFDSLDDYYDGVCRQCDSLIDIEVTIKRDWYEVVRNFLADNDKTLRFKLMIQGEADISPREALLTFPEYVYDFNENTMARTIQFSIAGSGMFYRECIDRRKVDYRGYDKLFEKARIDGGETAQDIAMGRLLYPVELEDKYRKDYEDYIRGNAGSVLSRLVIDSEKGHESIDFLKRILNLKTDEVLFTEKDIDEAIKLSTDKKFTEVSAILMQYGKKENDSDSLQTGGSLRFEF